MSLSGKKARQRRLLDVKSKSLKLYILAQNVVLVSDTYIYLLFLLIIATKSRINPSTRHKYDLGVLLN